MTNPEPFTFQACGSLSPNFLQHFAEECFTRGPSRQILVTGRVGFHFLCLSTDKLAMKMNPYNKGQDKPLWKVTWPCGTWIVEVNEDITPFTMHSYRFETDVLIGSLIGLPSLASSLDFKS